MNTQVTAPEMNAADEVRIRRRYAECMHCGFEPAGAWTLPGATAGFGFDALDDLAKDTGGLCVASELSYGAVDLDGDRILDLVVTDGCDPVGAGTTHWRVFRGACAP